jgi:hypothetical protein
MNNSAFQINSFIDETNSFVFARDKARKVGTTDEFNESDYSFDTSSYTGTWVNPNGVVRGTVS